jgi:formylmethanofuran dehydrogenase subunit B
VLAWQTGYGGAVDLAGGHPELVTATEPLAANEGVDVALRVEGDPVRLPAGVAEIALCSRPVEPGVVVSIRTGAAGVEATGTVHRLDGVPLTLQAPAGGDAPAAAALLTRLLAEVEP